MKIGNFKLYIISPLLLLAGCNDDDSPNPAEQIVIPDRRLTVKQCESLSISASLTLPEYAVCKWKIIDSPDQQYALTGTDSQNPVFIAVSPGLYVVQLESKINDLTKKHLLEITVTERELSPYINSVHEFSPSVGQYVNKLPVYEDGDTAEDMRIKAENNLAHKLNGSAVSLGGFGGSITYSFDHTIVNLKGKKDFKVLGNASSSDSGDGNLSGSCEPGIVLVAYDSNKNGIPDEDEWYEIAGSEYNNPLTIKDYKITYHKPLTEELFPVVDAYITNPKYIQWEDNRMQSGYKKKITFHSQSYYPAWMDEDELTFTGTLLPPNGVDVSGKGSVWVLYAYGFGYADNVSNNNDDSSIDISWAVDRYGNPVELPGVDFIKVYTGINQECGWLGEISTEISGSVDLHIQQ